jgi:hypothetical protein
MSHNIGEATFSKRFNIDLKGLASEFMRKSPHLKKLKDFENGAVKSDWSADRALDDY